MPVPECFDVMPVLSGPQMASPLLRSYGGSRVAAVRRELIMTARRTGLEAAMITGDNRRAAGAGVCQIGTTGA